MARAWEPLLDELAGQNLKKALALLLGGAFRLVDTAGTVLAGAPQPLARARRVPVSLDGEIAAFLECAAADDARLQGAALILELLLGAVLRHCRLAGDVETRVREQIGLAEEASRQIYQAEKLASVGRLAAGVAHEINNPIGYVRSNLSSALAYLEKFALLGEAISSGQAARERWRELDLDFVLEDFSGLMRESLAGVDRVANIVADLKGFSNIDHGEEEMADLNDSLRQACSVIEGQLPGGVTLVRDLDEIPRILCLPGYLNQAFLNLLENAVQAMPEGGEVTVRSRHEGGEILIHICDTGHGIPEEVLPRIFDPFFTTRDVGRGTGLGLTVVRDIVQVHGGRVEVESRSGAGTCFTIRLPL